MLSEYERHEMTLVAEHESGAEEWQCPDCGRHFIMNWQPTYSKVVIQPGDEYAQHSGSRGGLMIGAVHADEAEDTILSDELRDALDDLDLDALFDLDD